MSPSHLLVPILRILTLKPVVLDAGWPLLDGYKARGSMIKDVANRTKYWMIDFISFHTSNLVLFESGSQCNYSKSRYLLSEKKIAVSFTGFDETKAISFFDEKEMTKIGPPKSPYVLFRGKPNDEAGLQNIVNAFNNYEVSAPLLIVTNHNFNLKVDNKKIKVIKGFISNKQMSDLYKGAVLCLGQLSSHPRLERTIPHKAFEAGYYGVPYISTQSAAVSEIFQTEYACHFLDNVSPDEIAQTINEILDDSELIKRYANEIQEVYRMHLSQEKIYADFIKTIEGKGFI